MISQISSRQFEIIQKINKCDARYGASRKELIENIEDVHELDELVELKFVYQNDKNYMYYLNPISKSMIEKNTLSYIPAPDDICHNCGNFTEHKFCKTCDSLSEYDESLDGVEATCKECDNKVVCNGYNWYWLKKDKLKIVSYLSLPFLELNKLDKKKSSFYCGCHGWN